MKCLVPKKYFLILYFNFSSHLLMILNLLNYLFWVYFKLDSEYWKFLFMYSLKEIKIILIFLFPKFKKILNFIFKFPSIFQHLNNGIKIYCGFVQTLKTLIYWKKTTKIYIGKFKLQIFFGNKNFDCLKEKYFKIFKRNIVGHKIQTCNQLDAIIFLRKRAHHQVTT